MSSAGALAGTADGRAAAEGVGEWTERPGVVWAALGAVTLVGFLLRVLFLGDQSLGYEETFTASIVAHSTPAGVWRAVGQTESTPPLYYLLTWVWVHATDAYGEASLRTVSMLTGSMTVPLSFLAVRRLVGTVEGLAVALLCAVNPLLVGFSTYARSYALLVLFAVLSIWGMALLLDRPSRSRWTLWGLAAAAALWTHYFLVFLVLAEVGVLLVRLPAAARLRLGICTAAVAVVAAPLLTLLLSQTGDPERTAYISAQPLTGRVEQVARQFSMGTNVPSVWLEAAGIALAVGGLLVALVRGHQRPSVRTLLGLAAIGGGLPILTAATGVDDHFLARNILGIWICVAGLAAIGLVRARGLPLVVYAALCLVSALVTQTDWRYESQSDWRGASARIRVLAGGAPIAVMPARQLPIAEYYLRRAGLPAPLATSVLWVMVEPRRGPGQRALTAVADPPLGQLWGPGFHAVEELDHQGFRMIELRSAAPVAVAPRPAEDGPAQDPLVAILAP